MIARRFGFERGTGTLESTAILAPSDTRLCGARAEDLDWAPLDLHGMLVTIDGGN